MTPIIDIYKLKKDELYHYGILGMKWGVRRDKYLKEHVIPKGTKMYRSTVDPNESTTGNKYVSYLPPDRDMYRGTYADQIRSNYGKDKETTLYENTYLLKKDLKVPSRAELKDTMNKILNKDKEIKTKVLENMAKNSLQKLSQYDYFRDKNGQWKSTADLKKQKAAKKYVDDFIKEHKDLDTNDPNFFFFANDYGKMKDKTFKNKVISELKKKGYNAMVDEAGVGTNKTGREGVDPLIIFEGEKYLLKNKTKKVSSLTQKYATNKYMDWFTNTNLYYRSNPDKYNW